MNERQRYNEIESMKEEGCAVALVVLFIVAIAILIIVFA